MSFSLVTSRSDLLTYHVRKFCFKFIYKVFNANLCQYWRESWSSGYGRRLTSNRLRVCFPAPNTGWTFFTYLYCCKKLLYFFEKTENLIHKGQCLYVCVCVLHSNPNCWTDLNEIWHGRGPGGREGRGGGQPSTPTPWVQGAYRGSEVPLEPQSCILKNSPILSISCYEVANSHGTSHWPTGGHHHTVFQL